MKLVDLSHTEGIEQVAPNQFRRIEAGYPIELHGGLYLVLNISPSVRVRPSDDSEDLIIARMHLHKLTKSGAYSNAKDAFCYTFIRMSGVVEKDFRTVNELRRRFYRDVQEYNAIVRSGRDTSFRRNRYFDVSLEAGIRSENTIESEKSFFPGWHR